MRPGVCGAGPRASDAHVVMHADADPTITGTVTCVTDVGTVHVRVIVDGERVFEDVATDANRSVNIVI